MLIHFSAAKKGLFPLFREFFAGKSTFISFSRYFIALKTVVIPNEDGHHSNEDGREGDKTVVVATSPQNFFWIFGARSVLF